MHVLQVPVHMALRYALDQRARNLHITYASNPSFEEWVGMMQAIFAEEQYAPGWGLLSDRRAVREPQTKEFIEGVVAFLRWHKRELEHSRWAMVVSGVAVFGMARMAQELAGELPVQLGVFTDMDEASEWLNLAQPRAASRD